MLEFLEEIETTSDINYSDARFQVQYVIRPQTEELHDYRGYAGKVISGVYRKGDTVKYYGWNRNNDFKIRGRGQGSAGRCLLLSR